VDLIRQFAPDQYAAALESWAWLDHLDGKNVVFASAFGDLFLHGADGFWFLDTVDGTLSRRWPDAQTLQSEIDTSAAQAEYLMRDVVEAASQAGLVPEPHQVLAFAVPPVLGGPLTVENLEVADFVVALNIAGQIHEQVKDLPPGTKISGISVDGL
jgi:hypothetical protein